MFGIIQKWTYNAQVTPQGFGPWWLAFIGRLVDNFLDYGLLVADPRQYDSSCKINGRSSKKYDDRRAAQPLAVSHDNVQ